VTLQLVATVGLPASGKTTWLLEEWLPAHPGACRFNRDSIRALLWNDTRIHYKVPEVERVRLEKLVTAWQHQGIALALAAGRSVGVDDTNLNPVRPAELEALALAAGAEFVLQDFRHVPVEECIRRDLARFAAGSGHLVGEDGIRWMHSTYIARMG
jgi:predicted kinase